MSAQGGKVFLLKLGNGVPAATAVTFQNTGETVTYTAHGLPNGTQVKFATVVTTTTLVVGTLYYVIGATANTFQVSLTLGGAAVNIDADGSGTMNEYFASIGGLRSTSFSMNNESVDITSHDSAEWSEILSGAGIRSVEISGDGVFADDASLSMVRSLAISRVLRNFQVHVNATPNYWGGSFMINSIEQSGDYNNEQTYSMSLASSGPVTYT